MPEFLRTAESIALEAGDIIAAAFGMGTAHVLKDDSSPITATDAQVNEFVMGRLSEAFPGHSLLGEEGSRITDSDFMWVFDPIDGTVPFIRGIPTNVFSLALVRDGEPIVGVVYDPYLKRLYSATKGGGAFLNGTRMRTSSRTELPGTYVELSGRRPYKDLSFFERLREQNVRFLSYNSTVYAHMLLAAGQIEGVVYAGDKPWDQAATKIIVEEAGGTTSSIRGIQQRYDGPIDGFISGCTPEYHAALLALISPSLT